MLSFDTVFNGKTLGWLIALLLGALIGGAGGYLVLGRQVMTESEFQARVNQTVDDAIVEFGIRIEGLDAMRSTLNQLDREMSAMRAQIQMLSDQVNRLETKIDGHIRQWPNPGSNGGGGTDGAGAEVPGPGAVRAPVP